MEVKDYEFDIKNLQFMQELSPEDERDYCVNAIIPTLGAIPDEFMVSNWDKVPVYNQGFVGSCVSHTVKSLKEMNELKEEIIK